MAHHPELRIGDRERQVATDRLREAYGQGTISLEELEQRLDATMRARTQGDLEPLLADLPSAGGPPSERAVTSRTGRTVVVLLLAVLGLALAAGRAVDVDAVAVFGSGELRVQADERVDVLVLFGSMTVQVPEDVTADLGVTAVFGSAECPSACTGGSSVAEIDGFVLFGSVEAVR